MTSTEHIKQYFKGSADVKFQTYHFSKKQVLFIYCESMVDMVMLQEVVVPRLAELQFSDEPVAQTILNTLHVPELQQHAQLEDVVTLIYRGSLIMYFEQDQLFFSINIIDAPNRSPEEARSEVTVRGPRDDFIEDIRVNIALIRKRLPTHSLCVEQQVIGQRSETVVAILYFQDIVDLNILKQLKAQLAKIETDIVLSGELLMEDVNKSAPIFPRMDYTARPDYAVQALARGRFIVMVDGISYVIITPVNLLLLLKTGEDNEYPFIFGSVERLLRLTSLMIGVLLPGFWLALTNFHPNQLPFQLLATVIQSNSGLPFPSAVEMLLMILMFELLREAGFRFPSVIGGTIGVVGGLIIGDAAIRAGLTSPAMVVIIATSMIATYTLVNQSLSTAVSLTRVYIVLCSAFFGFYGFFIAVYFLLVYLANIRIFGVPYLNVAADLSWKTLGETFLKLKQKQYKERPSMLKPNDKTRQKKR